MSFGNHSKESKGWIRVSNKVQSLSSTDIVHCPETSVLVALGPTRLFMCQYIGL